MLQDIFTNIFLQADFKTTCYLRILSKQTYDYCDKHLLTSKLTYPVSFKCFSEWLRIYHDDKVKVNYPSIYYNYDKAIEQAEYIMALAKSSDLNIYVRISIKNHLIYKLLGIDRSNYNTITFHVNKNIISFRMLKLCELSRTLYGDERAIVCTNDAFLHYLTVIAYDHKYDKIIDSQRRHFLPSE
jgi:hypothetical protein